MFPELGIGICFFFFFASHLLLSNLTMVKAIKNNYHKFSFPTDPNQPLVKVGFIFPSLSPFLFFFYVSCVQHTRLCKSPALYFRNCDFTLLHKELKNNKNNNNNNSEILQSPYHLGKKHKSLENSPEIWK